jgi:hypothetical protein
MLGQGKENQGKEEMKVCFSEKELQLLDVYVTRLVIVASADKEDRVARIAAKMKYKFRGTPLYVFLNGNERKVLTNLASYRLSKLTGLAEAGDEADTLKQLLEKMENPE